MLGGIAASILMLAPFVTLALAGIILVSMAGLALAGRISKSGSDMAYGVSEVKGL